MNLLSRTTDRSGMGRTTRAIRVEHWTTVAELRAAAAAWNDLWERTPGAPPTARAEPLAVWLESFAVADSISLYAVMSDEGRLLAALPLVARCFHGVPVRELPVNAWADSGRLLCDPAADGLGVLSSLFDEAMRWPAAWLGFSSTEAQSGPWPEVIDMARAQGCVVHQSNPIDIGLVDIDRDWPAYEASLSRNLRQQMHKMVRKAARAGDLTLRVLDRLEPDEVEPWMRSGFEIEDRSWKGATGTSVLRTEGMFEFFVRQARALCAEGMLHLTFAEISGRPIAFEYGHLARGVYYSPKVGYDPAYAQYCPGQLLRWLLFERFHTRQNVQCVDFSGPLAAATARWITRKYRVESVRIVPPGLRSWGAWPLLAGYKLVRRLRRGQSASASAAATAAATTELADGE